VGCGVWGVGEVWRCGVWGVGCRAVGCGGVGVWGVEVWGVGCGGVGCGVWGVEVWGVGVGVVVERVVWPPRMAQSKRLNNGKHNKYCKKNILCPQSILNY
jgi:hypothetical protein